MHSLVVVIYVLNIVMSLDDWCIGVRSNSVNLCDSMSQSCK